jgi:hypothetical protein
MIGYGILLSRQSVLASILFIEPSFLPTMEQRMRYRPSRESGCVFLAPESGIRLYLEMSRFVNYPSYETPWASPRDYPALIRGREEYAEIF